MEEAFPKRQFHLLLGPVGMKLPECGLFDTARRPAQLKEGVQSLFRSHLPQNFNLIVIRFHSTSYVGASMKPFALLLKLKDFFPGTGT